MDIANGLLMVVIFIVGVALVSTVLLISRGFFLWYFRINEALDLLKQIVANTQPADQESSIPKLPSSLEQFMPYSEKQPLEDVRIPPVTKGVTKWHWLFFLR